MSRVSPNESDKVYTPSHIVDEVLNIFTPSGVILEPAKGGGAFLNKLPADTLWCEIDDGIDFFDFRESVDWIVTNPPYSIFNEFLTHSLSLANDVLYIIPVNKILSSLPRLMQVEAFGGIRHIHYLGSGRQIGFPFGFPVGAVHLKKKYSGDMKITYAERCYDKTKRGTPNNKEKFIVPRTSAKEIRDTLGITKEIQEAVAKALKEEK